MVNMFSSLTVGRVMYLNDGQMFPKGARIFSELGSTLRGSWEFLLQGFTQAIRSLPPFGNVAFDYYSIEVCEEGRVPVFNNCSPSVESDSVLHGS